MWHVWDLYIYIYNEICILHITIYYFHGTYIHRKKIFLSPFFSSVKGLLVLSSLTNESIWMDHLILSLIWRNEWSFLLYLNSSTGTLNDRLTQIERIVEYMVSTYCRSTRSSVSVTVQYWIKVDVRVWVHWVLDIYRSTTYRRIDVSTKSIMNNENRNKK